MADNNSNFRVRKGLTLQGDTSGAVDLAAPAVAGSQSYTLPTAVPVSNGYVLASTTGGIMSWVPDNNTTYDFNATSTTGGANLNLVGSDSTTDTVKLTNAGHITATYTSATEVTLGSDATDANTVSTIVARDASGNFSAGTITANSVAVAYNGASGSTGSLNVGGALNGVTDTNIITSLVGTSSTYAYAALQNKTTSAASYGAYSLYNDLGTVYGELGMTSSTYNYASAGFPNNAFSTPNTTFLQSGPNSELTIGTNGSNSIHFVTNGGTQTTEAMTISPTNAVTMSGTLGVTGAATTGTLSRVLGQQINTRNSTYTAPTIPLTVVTGLNGLAVASSTGGYLPDISVNNYLADTSAGNNGAGVSLRSTSGTSASPTGTANNQIMGTVNFDGWATGTNANWASYTSTAAGGPGGGASYVYPLQTQTYARQAFTNGTVSTAVTGASGNGTTATLTFAQLNVQTYFAGGVITVAGMTPSGYNGTYTITAATTTSVSYLNATTGFTSGGTISLPVVSAAGTGYRIRGFQTSTPLIGANRINFADFNASSTTFKSAAYTFTNEVIPGATQTATNYLTLGSGGSTFTQTTGSTTINNSTMINENLTVKSTLGGTTLSTFGDVVFTQTQYSTSPFTYPLRISGKRTDNVNPQNDDTTGYQFQLFGSGSNFVNLGSMSMKYKTSGDNSIEFFVDNNAGPSVSTNPMTISAPQTVIRAGTNASVSAVVTVNPTNVTFAQPIKFPAYTAATANTITGAVGWQISISDSPVNGGKMAYWDTTNNRWSYIDTNLAV